MRSLSFAPYSRLFSYCCGRGCWRVSLRACGRKTSRQPTTLCRPETSMAPMSLCCSVCPCFLLLCVRTTFTPAFFSREHHLCSDIRSHLCSQPVAGPSARVPPHPFASMGGSAGGSAGVGACPFFQQSKPSGALVGPSGAACPYLQKTQLGTEANAGVAVAPKGKCPIPFHTQLVKPQFWACVAALLAVVAACVRQF